MELRRALLLFAIVLGLAAIATSLSGPTERQGRPERSPAEQSTPNATALPAAEESAAISFSASGRPRTERLEAGRPAVVTVKVVRAGQVELSGLGLSSAAEPLTPARFDVFERRAGSHDVLFRSAESGEVRKVGKLRIVR
ncbi:MAG TPA: hypothetical protein VGV10_01030 [Thermoleophilaceae bacterium]|nr:hypothetical protein [Thermoleophilaceae bacterium]